MILFDLKLVTSQTFKQYTKCNTRKIGHPKVNPSENRIKKPMAWKHIIRLPSIINGLIPVDVPFNFSSHACWIKLGFRYNDHKILNPIPPKAEALKIDILPIIISKLLTESYSNQIIWKLFDQENATKQP